MYNAEDIIELENKYLKYSKKKRRKYFILLFILIIVALCSFYYKEINTYFFKITTLDKKTVATKTVSKKIPDDVNSSIETKKKKTEQKKPDTKINKVLSKIPESENNTSLSVKKPTLENNKSTVSNPPSSLSLKMPEIDITPQKEIKKDKKSLKIDQKIKKTPTVKPDIKAKQETNAAKKEAPEKPQIKIEMKNIDSVKYLKDKFNENHSIIFALMLCKEYYDKKDFVNSLKWSVIANDLDSTNERSWIWFAKSKYRLNQKQDAITALKAYLKTNRSDKIKALLHDIINGDLYD